MRPFRTAILLAVPAFYPDVLPVFERHCLGCHRPGGPAPMALHTFESARPYAKAIRDAVVRRSMPPWFAEGPEGHFANDPRMSESAIRIIRDWVAAGAPQGTPKEPPPARTGTSHRDATITIPSPIRIPAQGFVDYQHVIVPTGFAEDRWVTALELRPSAPTVVHHAVVFVRPPRSEWLRDKPSGTPFSARGTAGLSAFDEVIAAYLPGSGPQRFPEGHAKLIPAGSDLVFQIHYTPNGKPTEDRPALDLTFSIDKPRFRIYGLTLAEANFEIPPHAAAHRVESALPIQTRAAIYSLAPHMHLRGKSMRISVAGRTLLNVPRYDFQWQLTYILRKPLELARGEEIEMEAIFDNSRRNRRNPDPSRVVRWGEQSDEEMAVCFIDLIIPASASPNEIFRGVRIGR